MARISVTAFVVAAVACAAHAQETEGYIAVKDAPVIETPAIVVAPPGALIDTTAEQRAYERDVALPDESDGVDYIPPEENLVKKVGGVTYATGGVGEDERAQIKSMESQFNLKVLVTTHDGAYIGDYSLRIMDAEGKNLLEATGDGPYFLAKLPAGTYSVEVSDVNTNQKPQKVKLGESGLKTIYFRW